MMTQTPLPPRIHVLAKPTGAMCNLDCSYCFFLDKELLYPGSHFRMPDDVLETYIRQLIESHRSKIFDRSGIRRDPNLAFPIDRLKELGIAGRIGAVNERHLSLMGSITAPGRLIKRTAPEAVQCLVDDGVDVALLVPV